VKNLSRRAKNYFFILILCALIFGQVFYLLLAAYIIYFFVYKNSIDRVNISLKTNISSFTFRQRDSFTFSYSLKFDSQLPQLFLLNFMFPFYIVPVEGKKKEKVFARNSEFIYTFKCKANKRGIYEIGTLEAITYDPLGLFIKKQVFSDYKKIFVFPFLVPFEKLKIYLSEPIEGLKAKYKINRDYSYVAGVRDYTEDDPVSRIHWKQTAHKGSLLVKEFDFSASKKIIVSVNFYGRSKNTSFEDYSTSIAASICYYAFRNHLPFGVIVNFSGIERSDVKAGEFHLMNVFKMLSLRINNPFPTSDFIKQMSLLIPFGSELFYIDRDLTKDLMLEIIKLKHFASKINIILLPDNTFVLPNEKPPRYFFKESMYMKLLGQSADSLAKEGIFVYPILGKDYASMIEV
jgi:uncharacterized protein (DUF58 family)